MSKITEEEMKERKRDVKFSLAVNAMDNVEPTEEALNLMRQYSDGEITREEAKNKLIEKYSE